MSSLKKKNHFQAVKRQIGLYEEKRTRAHTPFFFLFTVFNLSEQAASPVPVDPPPTPLKEEKRVGGLGGK